MTDEPPSDPASPPRRTSSVTRQSRWPGWIWSVPLAAVGIVTWLLVRTISQRGIDVTVTFADGGEMKARDTQVTDRGLQIGKVTKVELTKDRRGVLAHLDLDKSVEKDLTTGTRFYLLGGKMSFSDPSSLKALVAGPSIVMVPGSGPPSHHFSGGLGEPPEKLEVTIPFIVNFSGNVGELKLGTRVRLRGFTVGTVAEVRLVTDSAAGEITTSVLLDLDPTRFNIRKLTAPQDNWPATFTATMTRLVRHGLRATLQQSPMLVGAEQVELVISPEAAPAELLTKGAYPEIPAENAGLTELAVKLGRLPVTRIGDNVRAITEQIKAISGSPQLQESLSHLDRSLAELERTLHAAGPQVAPMLASARETVDGLHHTADDIDATAEAARRLLGGSAASPNGNLQQAVHELTGTARAIRTLANYLDQHPEALLRGRAGELDEERR
jgi:paraquat-inducible protein B